MMPVVTLVVPMHNEAAALPALLTAVRGLRSRLTTVDLRLTCIDDGSTDGTAALLAALTASDSFVAIIELSRNFGKEAALSAGLELASGDALIPFDADLQDPIDVVEHLIDAWRQGADNVLARRVDRSSDSRAKRLSAHWFYRMHNRLSAVPLPENVGDFRLIDRKVVEVLKRLPERQRFMKGLLAWPGFSTVSVDYVRAPRSAGTSKFSGFKLWNLALEGITGFSTAPLKVWSYVGAAIALLSIAYAVFLIGKVLVLGRDVPGYTSLMVALCFFSGLQMIGIGILGEYLGRVYMESKHRPLYVVRQVHGTL